MEKTGLQLINELDNLLELALMVNLEYEANAIELALNDLRETEEYKTICRSFPGSGLQVDYNTL